MHWRQLVCWFHRRKISRRASLQRESRRRAALASHASDGRSRPRRASRSNFCQRTCGQDCLNRNEPCSCRNKVQWPVLHWFRHPQTESPSSNRYPSAFSSFAAFACLSLCVRCCRCGRPLDAHARQQRFWARRGWALQSVAARVCREAGARVWTNVFVRDMDLAIFDNLDGRRLEVVADGLPVHGGAQVAIDTTMVSPLHSNGVARRGASVKKGLALEAARKRKEMTYPELAGEGGRARLAAFRSCTVPVLLGLGQDSRPPRGVAGSRCAHMDQSLEQTTELCCHDVICDDRFF